MKHNNKITLMALGIGAALFSAAPSFAEGTADATLNVALSDVKSITVAPGKDIVSLNFVTSNDYQDGVSSGVVSDQLTVASTGPFKVTVKASGDLNNIVASENIPIADISVLATAGSGSPVGAPTTVNALSTSEQNLITSPAGTLQDHYSMEYKATGGADFIGKTAGTFTTTIIYTIEAP